MEELLSDLNKFNVKTEEELFVDQFSKLSAGNSNIGKTTENQSLPSNKYATHKMFGKDISDSTTSKQENIISINTSAINNNAWNHQFGNNNDDAVAIGWNQTPKVIEDDDDWGKLPDVNTSIDPNHRFGMNSLLSAEILNLANANVNQQRIFGSEYMKNWSNNNSSKFATASETARGFTTTAEGNFKSVNK